MQSSLAFLCPSVPARAALVGEGVQATVRHFDAPRLLHRVVLRYPVLLPAKVHRHEQTQTRARAHTHTATRGVGGGGDLPSIEMPARASDATGCAR